VPCAYHGCVCVNCAPISSTHVVQGGYACVPEWNCRCADASGDEHGGGGELCGCVAWGSGSMHLPPSAPKAWRTGAVGVGRNEVEAEWGSTGGGHTAPNCSHHHPRTNCVAAASHSCEWVDAAGGQCVDRYSVSTALTYAADLVRGYWFSTQAAGQDVSWHVISKSIANATCVNAHVNEVIDRAGAAACREERKCPGASTYPLDGASVERRNCWVECFSAALLGHRVYPSSVTWSGARVDGVSSAALVAAFETGFTSAECQIYV
jgi:hypothetical protein